MALVHMMITIDLVTTQYNTYSAPSANRIYLTALDQVITNTKEQMTLLNTEIQHSTLVTI